MANDETVYRFIDTLKDLADQAKAHEIKTAEAVLRCLIGAMYNRRDVELCQHLIPFADQEIARAKAAIREGQKDVIN